MFGYALRGLRFRVATFVGAFVALFFAAALVSASGILLQTGLRGGIATERYAAAPVVVAADQNVHQVAVKTGKHKKTKDKAKPLAERVRLPADLVPRVAAVPGVRAAVPELDFPAYAVTADGAIVSGPHGSTSWGHAWRSAVLTPFRLVAGHAPRTANEVVLDHDVAARAGVAAGDTLTVQSTGAPGRYRVSGIAAPTGGDLRDQSALFFSTGEARRLDGHPGTVAAIGVLRDRGVDPTRLARAVATATAGSGAVVHGPGERGAAEFLDAADARVRLVSMAGAIGGTSALVAILVVVGTCALSVQQRRRELALLRAIGATPRQLRAQIGREALLVGAIAGVAGAAAGMPLASWLYAAFVSFGVVPATLHPAHGPLPLAVAVVVTTLVAVAAALVATRRTSRIRPAEALAEAATETRPFTRGRLVAGTVALAGGVVLTFVLAHLHTAPASSPLTYVAVVVLCIAVAFLGPALVRAGFAALGPPLRLSRVSGYLGAANGRTELKRYAGVITPLVLLVGMSCAAIFAPSTLGNAADREATAGDRADMTVVSTGPGVPGAAADAVRRLSGVRAVAEVTHTTVRIGLARFGAQGVTPGALPATMDLGVVAGSVDAMGDTGMAVSEVAARGVGGVGTRVPVTMGDRTRVRLTVRAVYRRGLGFGDLTLPHGLVAAHVDNPLDSALLVGTGTPAPDVTAALRGYPGVRVLDRAGTASLRSSGQQSDAVIGYLAMALVVAFTAIAAVNGIAMATVGRVRELALLRLVGTSRRQVVRMLRLESVGVVLIAVVLGSVVALAVLTAYALGMTGDAMPYLPPLGYLGVVAVTAALALTATAVAARVSLTGRPADVISTGR